MDPAADLEAVYKNRFSQTETKRQLVWAVLTSEFFQQWIKAEDSVLDLGAGYCEFTNNIKAKTKYALDLNPTTAQAANSDVRVLSQDLTKTWQLEDNSINVVFSSNFLEHLPTKDAILHTFKEAHRVLAPGGKIILLGPNIRFCYDVYWDFFDHYIPLSDRSVNEALNLEGFETIKSIDRFLPFSMQNKVPTHPLLVSLYLRMPFVWPYFGKQFLIVANSNKKI